VSTTVRIGEGWQVDRHPCLVPRGQLTQTVVDIVATEPGERWLIWCDLVADVERYVRVFVDRGVVAIRGGEQRPERQSIIGEFRNGSARVLVAHTSALTEARLEPCARVIFADPDPQCFREHARVMWWCCGWQQTRRVQVYTVEVFG